MQLSIRRAYLVAVLGVALLGLEVALLHFAQSATKVQGATDPNANMSLSIPAASCDSSNGPTICNLAGGSTATVNFNALSAIAGGYTAYHLKFDFSGNFNYKLGTLSQTGHWCTGACSPSTEHCDVQGETSANSSSPKVIFPVQGQGRLSHTSSATVSSLLRVPAQTRQPRTPARSLPSRLSARTAAPVR